LKIIVYADETGTGGLQKNKKEPAPGVYGYLATSEMWEDFKKNWKAVLDQYGAPYFHFRELNKSERLKPKNPYHGWDNERADDFIYDVAIVASSGPIPFGGGESVKMRFGNQPTKQNLNTTYKYVFRTFFSDFSLTMDNHFSAEKDKVSFFFSGIDNSNWVSILNNSIEYARKVDGRIGGCEFVDPKKYEGIPCQAADLFAFVNRQNLETMYEAGYYLPQRILDLIIARRTFPESHPYSALARLNEDEWRWLVNDMRKMKMDFEISREILGEPKKQFYPALIHPYLKKL
jgi:hypothetical protein